MNTLLLTRTDFSFIQFREWLVVEIWVDNEMDQKYFGEMVFSMN
jgi:hypothetical protein